MSLKTTIMEMIKEEINIEVVDTPKVSEEKTNESLLFVDYADNSKRKLKVINYNEYDLYDKEVIVPNLEVKSVTIGDTEYGVNSYDSQEGILEIDRDIHRLMPYGDKIDLNGSTTNEFILVTSPYSYTRRLSKNLIEYYHNYQFDLFLYGEENNDRLDEITKKLHDLFSVDFKIDNTNSFAYIQSPLTIKRMEFLNIDKLVRGNILLRTY